MRPTDKRKRAVQPAAPIRRAPRAPVWILAAAVGLTAAAYLASPMLSPRYVLDTSADRNVLLVTVDTLRADALSAYGGPAQTPNIDGLAAHGARFTFAHSHAVVTLPSHTTILTGLLPYEHGIRDNSGFRVKPGTPTLATRLKAMGFVTGAFVGGYPVSKRFGLTPGFDIYDDQMPEMHALASIAMPERPADAVVERAVDWIGKQNTRFFAWVHAFDPHSPYKPPTEYATRYSSQPYYGEVAFVDHALGPLFERLRTQSRPTVVIVTADHGESLGEHGEMTHGMFAYESTLHVPLIVATITPGANPQPRGRVIDTPVRHADIAPTVLDIAGAQRDPSLLGTSLRDVIRNGGGDDRPAYFEAMTYNLVRGWAPLRGVLVSRDKYIDLPLPELYDLASDPRETENRAATQPDRVQVMTNTLRTYNVAPPNRPSQESPEAVAALRALGYVSGSAPAKKVYTDADDPKRLIQIDNDLHQATNFFEDGRTQDGIALLERVIEARPDTADAYITLAHTYWQAGQVQPALATLERGLRNGAPDRDIRIRLGLYLAESHTDSARAITLLEGMPSADAEALIGLGVAYEDAGRHADAARAFKGVLALDPTSGLAYQNLASIELRQALGASGAPRDTGLRQAEMYARQSLDADPSLAEAHTTMGVILSTTGRKGDAIESWKRAVTLDPAQFNALYNLWLELASAGRHDEAAEYGRQFVNTAPPAFFAPDIARVREYLQGRR